MAADELDFKQVGTLSGHYGSSVPIIRVKGPYGGPVLFYQCPLNVDWDGASKAYGVNRPGAEFPLQKGLDAHERGVDGLLKSGKGSDGTWAGVYSATEQEAIRILTVDKKFGTELKDRLALLPQFLDTRFSDSAGKFPVVQIAYNAIAKGYYVSQCPAIADPDAKPWDQHHYHDAANVAYGALSDGLLNLGPRLNDYGLIIRNSTGKSLGFFFGDRGGKGSEKVGESSGYVKTTLAPGANEEDETFSFFVFPGSGKGVPSKQAPDFIDMNVKFWMRSLFLAKNARALAVLAALGNKFFTKQAEMTPIQSLAYQKIKRAFIDLGWDPDGPAFKNPDVE